MSHAAQAFLNNRYDLPDNRGTQFPAWKMVTIDIRSLRGESIAVLHSEDSRTAIDHTLRSNGWVITSWSEDDLLLIPVNAGGTAYAPNPLPTPPQTIVVKQEKGMGCFGCLGIVIIFIVICVVVGTMITANNGRNVQSDIFEKCVAEVDTPASCQIFKK